MIIAMKPGVAREDIRNFAALLENQGLTVHRSDGASRTVLGLVGDTTRINGESLAASHLVEKVIRVQEPYKRANRMFHPQDTRIEFKGPDDAGKAPGLVATDTAVHSIGDGRIGIIAGPC